ncbi:MAG: helix-turn-helix domain-containing protein [Planctomycetota bacterium]|jgi:predicted ABC-class ATPase
MPTVIAEKYPTDTKTPLNYITRKIPALYDTIIALHELQDPPLSTREIARQVGVSHNTIRRAIANYESGKREPNLVNVTAIKKNMADKFISKANTCLEHITPLKLVDMSAYQLMGMAKLAEGGNQGFNFTILINQAAQSDPLMRNAAVDVESKDKA